MRQWIGSVLFTTYLFASVAFYGLVVVVMTPFGHRATYRGVLVWVDWTLALLERLCGLTYEVDGLDNLPSASSVILMKHSSSWETIAQLKLFPMQTWVMKRELLWAPVLGWVIFFLRPIAIRRGGGRSAVDQVIKQGLERLRSGLSVIIFPEGTRVPAGQTRRYGLSGTLLAQAAGQPVVPVAHNAGEYWPRRGWLKRPGTIRVVVGKPIPTADRDPRSVNQEAQNWIEAQLAAMKRADC